MAREIHEREDLLRDARALVPRLMLRVSMEGHEQEVFAGFRGESLSLYFGGDPVYHFNSRGELRRAYVDDRLVKAESGQLVVLERRHAATETELLRRSDDGVATEQLLSRMQAELASLAIAMANRAFEVVGQEPPETDGAGRLGAWLEAHPRPSIAASPRVG